MGFNKAKAVRAAEKYLAQGKIPHAIQEYARIVAADETDITALNMLGDLYARTGKSAEAVTSFTRVAEHYRTQGFALKAIAIYKKINRLNPQARDVALVLAELYSGQGMIVESRAQFLQIADAYTREGKARDALGILRRIADLDPANGEVRLRVAEAYSREGFADEALEAYAEAGARLLERRNPEAALDAFNQALALQPNDLRALQGFVSAHSVLESADEAAEVIEEMIARAATSNHADELYGVSHVTELRFLLLNAYLAAENPVAAERTVHALVASSASAANNTGTNRVKLFLDVARLYMRVGDTDSSVRISGHALEPMLTEREDDAMLEILNEALARNPEHIQALKFTARIHTWHHDEANLRQTLDRLIEAAEESGDTEEERRALEQITSLSPAKPQHTERLRALGYGVAGYANESVPPVPAFAPASNEVPTFESFMLEADANVAAPVTSDAAFANSNEYVFESFAAPVETPQVEWETNGANRIANETPAVFDSSSSFADLNDESGSFDSSAIDFGDIDLSPASPAAFGDTPSSQAESYASNVNANDDFAIVNFNHETPSSQSDRIFEALAPELESVDFYIAQGYMDVARDTLDMLERQYGSHREIEARRAQCVPVSPVEETAAPYDMTAVSFDDAPASFVMNEATSPSLANVAGENDDDDAAMLDFMLSPVSTPVAAPDPQAVRDAEVAAFVQSSSVAETENPNAYDAGLAEIFEEFKHAVEEEEVPQTADYETHYNLGIAYQEMGLLDEAVEEFQKAANICRPEDGTPRYLQCCNMLGHCFMEKRLYQLAVMWFRKGVDTPGHTEDEYQALRYELASAYERMGDVDAATNTFMQVYGMDVSYRGVAERLRDLRNKSIVTT